MYKYILMLLLTSCFHTSSALPKIEGEVWIIDPQNIEIYRELNNGNQERIPIIENPDMSHFVCIDTEYYSLILQRAHQPCVR